MAGRARGLPALPAAAPTNQGTPRASVTAAGCHGVIPNCTKTMALPIPAALLTHSDKFRIQADTKGALGRGQSRSVPDLCWVLQNLF